MRPVNLVCLSALPPCLSSLPAHRRHGEATCHRHMQPLLGTWRGDTCVHGLIVSQAIGFFTTDVNCLYEGVYYGPLAVLTFLLLISCSITSCLVLGPIALIAMLCYLLFLPLQVMSLPPIWCWTFPRTLRALELGVLLSGKADTCWPLILLQVRFRVHSYLKWFSGHHAGAS